MAEIELGEGCKKLDKTLAEYYKNCGKLDEYFPNGTDGDSIFAIWVEENGFDDDTLEDELNDEPTESTMVEFHMDDDEENNIFPLRTDINNKEKKNVEVYKIMKFCYTHGRAPGMNNLEPEDLDLNYDEKHIEECKKIYKTQTPEIFSTIGKEPDVMRYLATTKSNNDFPVLPTMVDCYTRYRLEAKLKDPTEEPKTYNQWIEQNSYTKKQKDKKTLEKALAGYCNRISPLFQFATLFAIDDDVSEIANYIAATSEFIKGLLDTAKQPTVPFQVDLCIAVKSVVPTSTVEAPDDDEDDPETKEIEVDTSTAAALKIGNVQEKLKHEKCKFVEKKLDDIEKLEKTRFLSDHFDEFKKKLKKEKEKGFNFETYPHSKRFIIFVDRRVGDEDDILFFNPPSVCNTIPKNHVPEWYFESARKCIIPRKGYGDGSKEQDQKEEKKSDNATINAQSATGGKFIAFSFHVDAVNKIKCYLFWNNQTVRFYPQDIVESFSFIFEKKKLEKFKSNKKNVNKIMKRICIRDEQYEGFYRSLCSNQTDFPRNKM